MWCLVRSTCGVVYVYIAVFACESGGVGIFCARPARLHVQCRAHADPCDGGAADGGFDEQRQPELRAS